MMDEIDGVYDKAAELFAVLSTPIRLRIISQLCQGEKNVGQLLNQIGDVFYVECPAGIAAGGGAVWLAGASGGLGDFGIDGWFSVEEAAGGGGAHGG